MSANFPAGSIISTSMARHSQLGGSGIGNLKFDSCLPSILHSLQGRSGFQDGTEGGSNLRLNRDRFSAQSPALEFAVSVVLLRSSPSSSAGLVEEVLFSLSEVSAAEARLNAFLLPACRVARFESNIDPAEESSIIGAFKRVYFERCLL